MIKQSGVGLHKWEIEYASDLTAAVNNKKVLDNLRDGIPYPYTEKDAKEFIVATLAAEKDSQYAFAVTYDGRVIGSIGVFRREGVHRLTAELGYYIAEAYWGKGIMTEAVRQMWAYVFENTDIIRIFAEPYAYNKASCRVLEKAGFQFEGLLRQNVLKNGQPLDMKLYAILKPPVGQPLIQKHNLSDCSDSVTKLFEYLHIGDLNDHMLNIITAENRTLDFHAHEDSDELFYVIDGKMQVEFEDGFADLNTGDLIVIPKKTRHRPVCTSLVKCLLIEKKGTLTSENTGGTYKRKDR